MLPRRGDGADGPIVEMPFGKYKGWELEDVPEEYLEWVWSECDLKNKWLIKYLEELFGETYKKPMPDKKPPKRPQQQETSNVSMDWVIKAWQSRMSMKYHPDRGGSHEQMLVVNFGIELLRELSKATK